MTRNALPLFDVGFCGLTQTKEERCAAKQLRYFLTEKMHGILQSLSHRRMLSETILERVRILLLAFQKLENSAIALRIGLERHCVGRWRRRWQESVERLLEIERKEPKAELERAIIDVLRDAPRSGSPGKFSAEQVAQVVATACKPPRSCGRPVETWTSRELVDEVQLRGIVSSISISQVRRFLRSVCLRPHHRKGWCFTTERDNAVFQAEVQQVCHTYLTAPEAYHQNNTRTVCVDEKTSVAANEKRAKTKHPLPGHVAKDECQYTRHGTVSLTGSWDVVLGQLIQSTIAETRNAQDFAEHIRRTVASDPSANWIFVVDNLNTHHGEPIVRLIAELLGIDQNELGDKKRRRGILGSTQSRRRFLTDLSHRIRFVFLPKHSSWLNQIEVIFGIIQRRIIRHGSFTSVNDLTEKLLTFIEYFNRTFAKPMTWTYTGRPTQSVPTQGARTWREKRQSKKIEQILALVA
jgi:transposase